MNDHENNDKQKDEILAESNQFGKALNYESVQLAISKENKYDRCITSSILFPLLLVLMLWNGESVALYSLIVLSCASYVDRYWTKYRFFKKRKHMIAAFAHFGIGLLVALLLLVNLGII